MIPCAVRIKFTIDSNFVYNDLLRQEDRNMRIVDFLENHYKPIYVPTLDKVVCESFKLQPSGYGDHHRLIVYESEVITLLFRHEDYYAYVEGDRLKDLKDGTPLTDSKFIYFPGASFATTYFSWSHGTFEFSWFRMMI